MSKSTKYLVAIVVLLGVNLWLFVAGNSTDIKKSEPYFESGDLSGVSRFIFFVDGDTTKIELTGQGWTINDTFKADESFMNTLISVLERVEVSRTVANWDREILGNAEVEFDFNSRYRFQFATNPTKTKSYFIVEGEAKEVSVPGYRDNVVDIFTLHPDQWRDRMIVDGNWRTIQKVEVQNKEGSDFEITFADSFFLIDGKQPTDSTAVINYLNQFEGFQANEMISQGRISSMDSLAETEPFALITIDDIKNEQPFELKIYPNLDGQAYHLVVDQTNQQMVIDARRVQQVLMNPNGLN